MIHMQKGRSQKQNKNKFLFLDKEYKINITEVPAPVIFPLREREKFKSLSFKAKLTKLQFLKDKYIARNTLIKIISGSKFLKLLEDDSSLYLRIVEDLDPNDLATETKILDYINLKYPIFVDSTFNSGMSGDINRLLISKGSEV